MEFSEIKNFEILNTQGRAILSEVCGQRQLQVCQNSDMLADKSTRRKRRRETLYWKGCL